MDALEQKAQIDRGVTACDINTRDVVVATPPVLLRLDFGCGERCEPGFEGVDKHFPGAAHKVDLFRFPLPWDDGSVDEIRASHFVEHIPAREIEGKDVDAGHEDMIGRDMFIAFFDECYRILKPEGSMTVIVPNLRSDRAFMDPTHRRFICAETFGYLNRDWRDVNKLGHYLGACDFQATVNPLIPVDMSLRHPEAQARMFRECWNVIADWHAVLKPVKGKK